MVAAREKSRRHKEADAKRAAKNARKQAALERKRVVPMGLTAGPDEILGARSGKGEKCGEV